MDATMTLVDLPSRSTAQVVEIQGGLGLTQRLGAMGIVIGKKLEKSSAIPMRGPVTVRVGNATVSIGYQAASRIIVAAEGADP